MPRRRVTTEPSPISVPFGLSNEETIYVNDQKYNDWLGWEFNQELNGVSSFAISFVDVTTAEQDDIQKEKVVKIFYGQDTLIFKGRIIKAGPETINELNGYRISGMGMECDLFRREVERTQYDNTATTTIVNNLCSDGLDGSSPWVIEPDGDNEDWGNYSFRGEYSNRWNILTNMAKRLGYDVWVDAPSYPFDKDYTYWQAEKGDGVASPVITFTPDGTSANCEGTSFVEETEYLVNHVKCLGYGDGVNQKSTSIFAASDVYSALASATSLDLSDDSNEITLDDASGFPNTGDDKIIICGDIITYTGITTNTLTGCTRDSSTTATTHPKDVLVFEYYDGTSTYTATKDGSNPAKSGSSIDTYNVKEKTFTDRGLFDDDAIQLWASNLLADFMTPPKRYVLIAKDLANIATVGIGDYVTVTDSVAGLSEEVLRVVRIRARNSFTEGSMLIYELSNKQLNLTTEFGNLKSFEEKSERFAQGTTFMYVVQGTENAEGGDSKYIEVFFDIPTDAIAINSIKLSYRNNNPRTWSSSVASGGSSTSGSSDTTEYTNTNYKYYDVGIEVDTSGSTEIRFATVPSAVQGTYNGCVVTYSLANLSGANDTYNFTLTNNTKSTTLATHTNVTINDTLYTNYNINLTSAQAAQGDVIALNITDGIVGTDAGYGAPLGWMGLQIQTNATHTHTTPAHTHTTAYDIKDDHSYTTTDISIYTTNDASGSPSWTDRTAAIEAIEGTLTATDDGSETDIDLTSYFTGTGLKGIQLRPDGNSRHWYFVKIKGFIESKA